MEIRCPSCAVRYDVPVELATGGRPMRCVRCGAVWTPGTVAEAVELAASPSEPAPRTSSSSPPSGSTVLPSGPAPAIAGEPGPATPLAAPSPPPPRDGGGVALAIGWTASLLVLLALGAGLVAERHAVMRAWPPSARLYGALGLRHAGARVAVAPDPGAPTSGQGGGGKARG